MAKKKRTAEIVRAAKAERPAVYKESDLRKIEAGLAKATTPEEVRGYETMAKAAVEIMKKMRAGLKKANAAVKIWLEARRKLGQMLKKDPALGRGGKRETDVSVLKEKYGIDKRVESQRLQKLAEIPDKDWREEIAYCNAEGIELTQTRMLRLHAKLFPKPGKTEDERGSAEAKQAKKHAEKILNLQQSAQLEALEHMFSDMGPAMGKRAWLEIGKRLGYRK